MLFKHSAPAAEDAPVVAPVHGKGRPTPTRAEQEAARRRPLVPNTKEDRARQKAELTAQRERARVGMANGEEKYLTTRDKGPQRRFVRDFVDGGWHIGELIMPAMVLVLMTMFIGLPGVQVYAYIVLWVFIVVVVIDMVITAARIKHAVDRKFGDDRKERGLGMYGAMRTIQMRWMRMPKPQVRRRLRWPSRG